MKNNLVDALWWVIARLVLIRWVIARFSPRAAMEIGSQMQKRYRLAAADKFYSLAIRYGDQHRSLSARQILVDVLSTGSAIHQDRAESLLLELLDDDESDTTAWALYALGRLERSRGNSASAIAYFERTHQWPGSYGNKMSKNALQSIRDREKNAAKPRRKPASRRTAASSAAFAMVFPDRHAGARIAADRGLVEALLIKEGRPDLVGVEYFGAPTQDGYKITFGIY
ncbi:hypothetical protein OG474_23995 [Kribbella sp. NBC_01505]|uniref:hypothetical protein n=1 Tax=Kribbella sp. NBC_01505 TaxID=2903580 RepID=UPI00386351FB